MEYGVRNEGGGVDMRKKIGFHNKKAKDPEESKSKDEEPDEFTLQLVDTFLNKFVPAKNIEDSTATITTQEMISAIKRFTQKTVSIGEMAKIFRDKGYIYRLDYFGAKYVFSWLVRELIDEDDGF